MTARTCLHENTIEDWPVAQAENSTTASTSPLSVGPGARKGGLKVTRGAAEPSFSTEKVVGALEMPRKLVAVTEISVVPMGMSGVGLSSVKVFPTMRASRSLSEDTGELHR